MAIMSPEGDTESRRLITQQSIDASSQPSGQARTYPDPGTQEIRILREIRGELAGIRTRLDSLVAIEKQLTYHGSRLSALERRFATFIETRLTPAEPATPTARACGERLAEVTPATAA